VASEAIPVIHLWLETQDEGMRRMQEGEAARKDASKYYADGDMKMGKDYSPSTTVFTESFPGAAGDRKYLYLSVNSVTGIVNRR
jgi:hypothetical protein